MAVGEVGLIWMLDELDFGNAPCRPLSIPSIVEEELVQLKQLERSLVLSKFESSYSIP